MEKRTHSLLELCEKKSIAEILYEIEQGGPAYQSLQEYLEYEEQLLYSKSDSITIGDGEDFRNFAFSTIDVETLDWQSKFILTDLRNQLVDVVTIEKNYKLLDEDDIKDVCTKIISDENLATATSFLFVGKRNLNLLDTSEKDDAETREFYHKVKEIASRMEPILEFQDSIDVLEHNKKGVRYIKYDNWNGIQIGTYIKNELFKEIQEEMLGKYKNYSVGIHRNQAVQQIIDNYIPKEMIGLNVVKDQEKVNKLLRTVMNPLKNERVYSVAVNKEGYIKNIELVGMGNVGASVLDEKRIYRQAVSEDVAGVILVHNHPSGGVSFSRKDYEFTEKIKDVLSLVDKKVYDSLVVGGSNSKQVYAMSSEDDELADNRAELVKALKANREKPRITFNSGLNAANKERSNTR